jgi:hypothetical protein
MSDRILYDRGWWLQIATDDEIRTWESPKQAGDYALSIGFKIQKNADLKANDAEITITNLSPAARAFIVKNANVELKAGYRDSLGLIFKGAVEFVGHQKQGTDWITTISARDGSIQWREQGISVTFKKDTPVEKVLRKLYETINEAPAIQGFSTVNAGIKGALSLLPIKVYATSTKQTAKPKAAPALTAEQKAANAARRTQEQQQRSQRNAQDAANIKLERARIFRGAAMQHLETLCRSYGLKAVWEDQALHIVPDESFTDSEVIDLTVESGLIGSPEPIEKGGWRVTSLLRHEFKLFRAVSVLSAELDGLYKIVRIEHGGERRGSDWFTVLEVHPIA